MKLILEVLYNFEILLYVCVCVCVYVVMKFTIYCMGSFLLLLMTALIYF